MALAATPSPIHVFINFVFARREGRILYPRDKGDGEGTLKDNFLAAEL